MDRSRERRRSPGAHVRLRALHPSPPGAGLAVSPQPGRTNSSCSAERCDLPCVGLSTAGRQTSGPTRIPPPRLSPRPGHGSAYRPPRYEPCDQGGPAGYYIPLGRSSRCTVVNPAAHVLEDNLAHAPPSRAGRYGRLMTAGERVVVVGAGVAGLTTAVVLAEAGAALHVIAEQVPRGARCRPGLPLVKCADRAGRSRAPSASLRDGLRPPLTVRPAPGPGWLSGGPSLVAPVRRSGGSRRNGEPRDDAILRLALDPAADGEGCEAQEHGFSQPGDHLGVGADGGEVLAGGAEDHRVHDDPQGLLPPIPGKPREE